MLSIQMPPVFSLFPIGEIFRAVKTTFWMVMSREIYIFVLEIFKSIKLKSYSRNQVQLLTEPQAAGKLWAFLLFLLF